MEWGEGVVVKKVKAGLERVFGRTLGEARSAFVKIIEVAEEVTGAGGHVDWSHCRAMDRICVHKTTTPKP